MGLLPHQMEKMGQRNPPPLEKVLEKVISDLLIFSPNGQGSWEQNCLLLSPALAGASHFPIADPGTKHLHLYALNLIYGGNYILACQLSSHKTKFIGITCS